MPTQPKHNYPSKTYLTGNTSGANSVVYGPNVTISGGPNVTLQGGPGVIVVQAAGATGSTVGIVAGAGTQTATSGTVAFANSNGISFGMSNSSQITASYTVPTQSHQPAVDALGISNTGHTAGNTGTQTGTWVFAGSSSLTISESTGGAGVHTLWFQPPVSSLAAGANITLSSAGSTVSIIGASGGGAGPALAAGTQTATSGTVAFANSNNFTFGMSGSTRITASFSESHQPAVDAFGASTVGNTAGNTGTQTGTWILAGSNSLTISESTGGAGVHSLWLQPAVSFLFAGGGISFSSNGNSLTIMTH